MSDQSQSREGTVPVGAELRINEVCDRFELAWQARPAATPGRLPGPGA
jgi:hypothetical protein